MSEPLTREQVETLLPLATLDRTIVNVDGWVGVHSALRIMIDHDAAQRDLLRQQLAEAQARVDELSTALEACIEGFSRPDGSSLLVRSQVYALLAKLKKEAQP